MMIEINGIRILNQKIKRFQAYPVYTPECLGKIVVGYNCILEYKITDNTIMPLKFNCYKDDMKIEENITIIKNAFYDELVNEETLQFAVNNFTAKLKELSDRD